MFSPEDFELPMEKKLRLRVINDELDHCDDVETLRENLKTCAATLMRYQHILSKVTERQLKEGLKMFGIMDVAKDNQNND